MRSPLFTILVVGIAALTVNTSAVAETIKTLHGKTYKKSRVVKVDPDGIYVRHSKGLAKVGFEHLSPALRKRFHFDKEKAVKFMGKGVSKPAAKKVGKGIKKTRAIRKTPVAAAGKRVMRKSVPVAATACFPQRFSAFPLRYAGAAQSPTDVGTTLWRQQDTEPHPAAYPSRIVKHTAYGNYGYIGYTAPWGRFSPPSNRAQFERNDYRVFERKPEGFRVRASQRRAFEPRTY